MIHYQPQPIFQTTPRDLRSTVKEESGECTDDYSDGLDGDWGRRKE